MRANGGNRYGKCSFHEIERASTVTAAGSGLQLQYSGSWAFHKGKGVDKGGGGGGAEAPPRFTLSNNKPPFCCTVYLYPNIFSI